MKTIICGAGKYTKDLLGRLGENWDITLIDPSSSRLQELGNRNPVVGRTIEGDASSPVVLEDAGVAEAGFVLALTDNDKVNLAVCRFAKDNEVLHILALVNDPDREPAFAELEVRAMLPAFMVGRNIYHYLLDPRINITSVAHGAGEVVEVDVSTNNWIVGLSVASFENPEWRVAALHRDGELLYPDINTDIREGDRLILIGKRDFFRGVCSLMECTHLPFPLTFGQGILLVVDTKDGDNLDKTIGEVMYLAPNTRADHVTVMRPEGRTEVEEKLRSWSKRVEVRTCVSGDKPLHSITEVCKGESIGLIVIRPFEKSFFKSLAKAEILSLAHSVPSPLLISRHTNPYKKILVPFNGSEIFTHALETALDLADQLAGEVDVAYVREPDFIHTEEDGVSAEAAFKRVREISHIHKTRIGEVSLSGNPVRELTTLAKEYNLMVMGSASDEKELFTPHVGELIVEKAPCSTLILAA